MTEKRFPEIQTERLLLLKLEDSDWKTISFLRSDQSVNRFVKRPSAETKEKALEFISNINKGIANRDLYYWKITERNNNKMIGSICLWNFSEDKKKAEVGYDLDPNFQGKGIMNESLKNIIQFGFNKLKLNFIEACTHFKNTASIKLLKKNDFSLAIGKKDKNPNNIVYVLKNPAKNNGQPKN